LEYGILVHPELILYSIWREHNRKEGESMTQVLFPPSC